MQPDSSTIKRLELLQPPRRRIRAVLDTDTYNEIDDQFALTQLLLSSDRIETEAIYAAPFFNPRSESPGHGMELSYDEILRLLERLGHGSEGFVYRGVTEFVGPGKRAREAEAVDDLISRARASSPGDPLYVIAIAAISTVASALLKAPDIIDRLVVVWLGGHALEWPDLQEFNLIQDVGGAQVLFDSGVPLVLVPCRGVASHLVATIPEFERHVEPAGEIGSFLSRRFKEYGQDQPPGWSKVIWDMAAIAWLIEPDWCPSVLIPTPILTDNATWSTDRSRPLMRYVHRIERNPIMTDFYAKLARFSEHGR
ncbi:nucleoside hydrolase [Devosia sp.]|uniref:nucleoside hydrolase n=1 Tax=Devosia sp. TaxID=1871048 RepID=UPI002AFDD29C|nr:nucleoside hydrolase [Devosia sp.]